MWTLPYGALALFFTLTTAAALPQPQSTPVLTTAQLLAIVPGSSSCDGAPYPAQCRTAEQAAPLIASSFAKYGITSPAEMAAVVGIMAFESGGFKYNVNLNGTPGKGSKYPHPNQQISWMYQLT